MVAPSFRKEIINQIDKLEPEQQRKVLDFARALASAKPRGIAGRDLVRFAGTIDAQDLHTMAQAIEQDCEKISAGEW